MTVLLKIKDETMSTKEYNKLEVVVNTVTIY